MTLPAPARPAGINPLGYRDTAETRYPRGSGFQREDIPNDRIQMV